MYLRTNSAQSEEEEKELVQRENFLTMQKAVTYYWLKEDDMGDSLRKTDLLKETSQTYDAPITVLSRRIEDELKTDEGQGVGTVC